MTNDRRRRSRGQAMVEFGLVVGLLMFLVVVTGQLAIYLQYRASLQLAVEEGAFEGSLAGHGTGDAAATANGLWSKLEPTAGRPTVTASERGQLVVVSAQVDAPAILPLPFPPFTRLPIHVSATHTVERFQPGSRP
jgi:TadE-like protein